MQLILSYLESYTLFILNEKYHSIRNVINYPSFILKQDSNYVETGIFILFVSILKVIKP